MVSFLLAAEEQKDSNGFNSECFSKNLSFRNIKWYSGILSLEFIFFGLILMVMHCNLLNRLIILLFIFCSLESEEIRFEFTPYPKEFAQAGFTPEYLQIGIDGRKYFLDTNTKTVGLIEGQNINWVGGFGFEEDEFIDPVSMAYSNLSLFILDQSQSRVVEFDSNLNFIWSYSLDMHYPDLIVFDPLNEFYILSNSEQVLSKYNYGSQTLESTIDLNKYPQILGEVRSIFISRNEIFGLLTASPDYVSFFNLSGRYIKSVRPELENPKWLFHIGDEWIVFNQSGSYSWLDSPENKIDLPIDNIHYMTENNGLLYALSFDGYYRLYHEE